MKDAPQVTARREDAAHEVLVESARAGRQQELQRARAFARIAAAGHFVFHGCAGVGEYGLRIGYGARQAREYAAAGRVIEACPRAAGMLLEGAVYISTLAIIEPWFVDADLPLPEGVSERSGRAFLEWAVLLPDRELRRAVSRCKAQKESGERLATRTLHLTNQAVEDLERVQVLVSRTEKRVVSQNRAAAHAFRFYVEKHDLREKAPRARRLPPMPARTDGSKNPRSVPAEVQRALMERHGDVCAIEFCEHRIWLENAHHVDPPFRAHALGGGNELADQDRICSLHHRMKDHGEIRWVPDPQVAGRGHYETRDGGILRLKPPRSPPSVEEGGASQVRERAPPFLPSRGGAVPGAYARTLSGWSASPERERGGGKHARREGGCAGAPLSRRLHRNPRVRPSTDAAATAQRVGG